MRTATYTAICAVNRMCVVIIIMLLAASITMAQEMYADVVFDVSDTGSVNIKGLTNHPSLSERTTNELTSKKGDYWVFNLSLNETFSAFVYSVELPEGAVISYAKGSTPVRIGNNGRTFVKATGTSKEMGITIQYSIENGKKSTGNLILIPVAVLLAVFSILAGIFIRSRRKLHPAREANHVPEAGQDLSYQEAKQKQQWYDKSLLAERQRQIVELMEKHGKPVTQKRIEEEMGIPKSSLSRNIESLIRRGIIKKEGKGMTNIISINPKKPEI